MCALKESGGLGIINLRTQNIALLAKWIWIMHSKRQSNWAGVLRLLYNITEVEQIGDDVNQSFFLKDLVDIKSFYYVSTKV